MTSPSRSAGRARDKNNPNNSASKLFVLILSCFFVSGLTGLIYQILWTRMIVKIIGSAPFAVTIVLTVFMGGLGLGSYLASRTIDQIKDPLKLVRLYGILELVIGAYGIVFPLLLILFRPLYAVIYNQLFHYFLGYNLITFAGCLLILLIPVTCMGATLPILSRFFITKMSRVGTHVGRLYGTNTIGAAAGALLCGFWLIQAFGVWGSLAFAVALNTIIGILCILVSHTLKKSGRPPKKMTKAQILTREKKSSEPDYSPMAGFTRVSALTIFAVSGFCAMAYEVIWTQLLGLIVGPTTYSFTIVLVTFITGLALGSLFFGWLSDRVKSTMHLLLLTQFAAALFALLLSQILGNSQIFFAKLIYHFKDHFTLLALLKASILFVFMFFPTFCLGATFPLVGKIYTRSLSQTGRSIGFAYAINSGGAILGSFIAGFFLIPLLGKEQGLRPVIALQLFTSLIIGGFLVWKARERLKNGLLIVLPALLVLVLLMYFPHWDRQMLSVGKYHRFDHPEIREIGWVEALFSGTDWFSQYIDGEVVYFGEGIAGFTTVLKTEFDILGNKGYALYSSGKPEASSQLDMDTQTLSAHVPLLLHKDPKTVLVVGLASGVTAGEVLHYPVERLDVIDINRQVVGASNFFRPWNNHVLSNPKTKLIIQDARAHMELSNRKYDVISAEPSNPWMAGLATLFTEDFFTLVRDRLTDDGIFAQFIHTYQMDWPTFALVGRTFSKVFPNSLLMRTNPSSLGPDFLLLGFKGNAGFKEHVATNSVRFARQSKNVVLNDPRVLYPLIVSEDLQRLFGDGPVNSDAKPWLEFSAPKLLHTNDPMIRERLNANRWLKKETLDIIRKNAKDVDLVIDFAAFTLSLIRPEMAFQNPVDLSRASDSQRARLKSIIKDFCTNNIVTDFSLVGDEELLEVCTVAQIESVRRRLPIADDKAPLYIQLGVLHSNLGKTNDALQYFKEALQSDPLNADANYDLALFLSKLGRTKEAIRHYSETLRLKPYYLDASNNLAWIYSAHGDPKFRNGEKAVKLAERICDISGRSDPALLDTLAAAYAETGRFEEARQTAREAADLAQSKGFELLATDINGRIRLYQSNRPFREKPPVTDQ
jgi:spermidine synthase